MTAQLPPYKCPKCGANCYISNRWTEASALAHPAGMSCDLDAFEKELVYVKCAGETTHVFRCVNVGEWIDFIDTRNGPLKPEHIPQIVDLISSLREKQQTYVLMPRELLERLHKCIVDDTAGYDIADELAAVLGLQGEWA